MENDVSHAIIGITFARFRWASIAVVTGEFSLERIRVEEHSFLSYTCCTSSPNWNIVTKFMSTIEHVTHVTNVKSVPGADVLIKRPSFQECAAHIFNSGSIPSADFCIKRVSLRKCTVHVRYLWRIPTGYICVKSMQAWKCFPYTCDTADIPFWHRSVHRGRAEAILGIGILLHRQAHPNRISQIRISERQIIRLRWSYLR